MVKQCPLVHVPLSDLAPPTTLQLLPQSPIRPILKVQQEYSGDVMTEAVRQERREKAKKSSWWWPAGVLASSMAGAAAVVAFRGCWHSKMSWPVGVQGCSYQVCLNCGAMRLFDEQTFSAYGPFRNDLNQLRAWQNSEHREPSPEAMGSARR